LAPIEDAGAGGGTTARIVISSEAGDVITPEGSAATAAIEQAVFGSPVAGKLSTEQPPFLSFLTPMQGGGQVPTATFVISSTEGDAITADGLAASLALQEEIFSSSAASKILQGDEPPLTSYLLPVEAAIGQGQADAAMSTQALKQVYIDSLDSLPPEVAGFLPFFSSNDADLSVPRTASGLVTVNLAEPLSAEENAEMTDLASSVDVADGYSVTFLPASPSAEDFKAVYRTRSQFVPAEQAPFISFLLSNDSDLAGPSASKGMIVVNLSENLTPTEQSNLTAAVAAADLPDGMTASYLPDEATTTQLKQGYSDQAAFIPGDQAEIAQQLLSSDRDMAAPSASHGLMIVLLEQAEDERDFEAFSREQADLVAVIDGLDLPDGFSAEAFSFELIFASLGDTTSEIGRMFGLAVAIILVILMFNFWTRDTRRFGLAKTIRRSVTVTFFTIITILMAITWMQGVGVLGGPKYFDVIGNFNQIVQILPILLIGLGVDYGIHMVSRYQEEVEDRGVTDATMVAIHTVGVALILATITTAVGFLTNLVSPLPALKDFGILAAVGILASFLLMMTFVPSIRLLLDRKAERGWKIFRFDSPKTFMGRKDADGVKQRGKQVFEFDAKGLSGLLMTIGIRVSGLVFLGAVIAAGVKAVGDQESVDMRIVAALSGSAGIFTILLLADQQGLKSRSVWRRIFKREAVEIHGSYGSELSAADLSATDVGRGVLGPVLSGLLGGVGVYALSVQLIIQFGDGLYADLFDMRKALMFGGIGAAMGFVLIWLPKIVGSTAAIAKHFAVGTVIFAIVLAGVGEFGRRQLSTEFSFMDFVPQDNPLLGALDLLTDEFGGGFGETTNLLIEGDLGTVETHNATVDAWGELGTKNDILVIEKRASAESVLELLNIYVTPGIGFVPDVAAVAAEQGLGEDLRVPDTADVSAIYDAVRAADEAAFDALVHSDAGLYDAALWIVSTQAGDYRVPALRETLNTTYEPVRDTGVSVIPTSENLINRVVVESLQDSQTQSLGITLAAATLLLIINFWVESRRPLLGLITMLPVGLVVLLTFGMMALTGIPFGPITATISALAIGIGVPYTIHITHRFQEDQLRFETVHEAVQSTMEHTGGALAGSALTTMAGFGSLVTSNLKPFQQFGAVTFYAIGFALLMSILILPSMLVLWDRWHRSRGDETLDEKMPHEALGM
jgi:predicted RND superfamily exporter protein